MTIPNDLGLLKENDTGRKVILFRVSQLFLWGLGGEKRFPKAHYFTNKAFCLI